MKQVHVLRLTQQVTPVVRCDSDNHELGCVFFFPFFFYPFSLYRFTHFVCGKLFVADVSPRNAAVQNERRENDIFFIRVAHSGANWITTWRASRLDRQGLAFNFREAIYQFPPSLRAGIFPFQVPLFYFLAARADLDLRRIFGSRRRIIFFRADVYGRRVAPRRFFFRDSRFVSADHARSSPPREGEPRPREFSQRRIRHACNLRRPADFSTAVSFSSVSSESFAAVDFQNLPGESLPRVSFLARSRLRTAFHRAYFHIAGSVWIFLSADQSSVAIASSRSTLILSSWRSRFRNVSPNGCLSNKRSIPPR